MKNKTKHTPGKWLLQRDGNDQPEYIFSQETTQWICQMNRLSESCIVTTNELIRREANAQLIAAAPNLLAACKELAGLILMVRPDIEAVLVPEYRNCVKEYLQRAEVAIAEATKQ